MGQKNELQDVLGSFVKELQNGGLNLDDFKKDPVGSIGSFLSGSDASKETKDAIHETVKKNEDQGLNGIMNSL